MHLLKLNLPMLAFMVLTGGALTYAVSSSDGEPGVLFAGLLVIILVGSFLYRDDTPPAR
jgi:hypothetical protein